mgnify:CR=1 FL=1
MITLYRDYNEEEIEELENSGYHQNKKTFEEFETSQGTKMTTIG